MNDQSQAAEAGMGGEMVEGRRPDPGSRYAARLAWVLGLALLVVLVVVNARDAANAGKLAAEEVGPEVPTLSDAFTVNSKLWMKLAQSDMVDPASAGMIESNIVAGARTDVDRLRLVMLQADLNGDVAGMESLARARKRAEESKDVPAWWEEDAASLERVLTAGETGSTDDLDALKARHGWFAEVLATRDLDKNDPARQALVGGAGVLFAMIAVASVVFVGGIVAGTFVVIGLVKGRFRSGLDAPLPGGSVYLETLVMFLIGFLALKKFVPLVLTATGVVKAGVEPPEWLTPVSLGTQWLLLPIIFWPMLRGVSWERWRQDIGWHSGKGFWKEVGAGVYAYFGGLPLLAVAAMMTVVIVLVRQAVASGTAGEAVPPPSNPIVEILNSASVLTMAMLFVLATVWAPLVEETLFRGGLFRQMRAHMSGMWGVLLAAGLSAIWFGLMHSYEIPLLLPVITLGFVFALMREWRGSLIPSMVAHGLHNATVLALAIGFLRAIA